MNDNVKISSIEININNKVIKLSLDDARLLYLELDKLFKLNNIPIPIPYPYPCPSYPQYPYPIITCQL